MSGTSMDAVDAALVSFDNNKIETIAHFSNEITSNLKQKLSALCSAGENEIERCCDLDIRFAELSAKTVNALLEKEGLSAKDISAIGSHGQTVRHSPNTEKPFSLQIGNPNIIAHQTGITTIADFRIADIAAGGLGAPLVPAFHQAAFEPCRNLRAIINIGGISNITLLEPNKKALKPNNASVRGYDIGPGNTLMDQWSLHIKERSFD